MQFASYVNTGIQQSACFHLEAIAMSSSTEELMFTSRRDLPTCLGPALISTGTWEQQSCSYLERDSHCCGSWDA